MARSFGSAPVFCEAALHKQMFWQAELASRPTELTGLYE